MRAPGRWALSIALSLAILVVGSGVELAILATKRHAQAAEIPAASASPAGVSSLTPLPPSTSASLSPPAKLVSPTPFAGSAGYATPDATYGSAFVYDATDGYPLLLDQQHPGVAGGVYARTTWRWDGNGWVQLQPSGSIPLASSNLAYDAAIRKAVVQSGGETGNPIVTWSWDGTKWVDLQPAAPPEGSGAHYLAFDQARNNLVLLTLQTDSQSTWTFDGKTCTRAITPRHPPAWRWSAAIAYDPRTATVLFFGGLDNSTNHLNDTWAWNGVSWKQLHPQISPPGGHSAMAYDAAGKTMVLLPDDMTSWAWDGTTWAQLPVKSPSWSAYASMTYDAAHRYLIFWEGAGLEERSSRSWAYAGGVWEQLA